VNPVSTHIQQTSTGGPSVLVVEDNDTTRERIAALFRAHGYEVAEAGDGLDALRKVSERQFHAIVLDLVLPKVDGWQFRAAQLRDPNMASVPTVILTVQSLRASDLYSLRTIESVQKPFEDAHLLQAVERACRTRQFTRRMEETSLPGLFWSYRGEIACVDHAPDATSDRWRQDRWAPIAAGAIRRRIVYRCQHCAPDGSPLDRSRRTRGRHGSFTETVGRVED
jgi:CheY-like chemotaxis protein